ncbi:restriction endonuclease [Marinitoga sp. 1155]|uniref:restriction endonuclease n=1 Tax=Marinitoga sp. 1155 TaxID=1428448 RepID=UPI0006418861|nr:DEAD/DEAH box helicase family protein [Marinitoga sp. 1155]KLO24961.1 type III restriction endonuclease subunit R [Marinitoga sp. 1155]
MKLKFTHLDYQEKAAMSVVNLFKGQPNKLNKSLVDRILKSNELINQVKEWEDISIFSNNKLVITEEEILKNLQEIQKENGLRVDKTLKKLDDILNFSIEMETGTGKTYVYTKTMFELNKHYGWNKFIIMVPSIAIREGVYKSLEITKDHFFEDYKKKIRFFIYDTKNKSNLINIKHFADTPDIEVIIMNHQAFNINKNSLNARIIYQELDSINSQKPIDLIKRANPILIIDEPQKFGNAEKKFKEFTPLFILRYSATHKKEYNKIYKLDAIDAYNEKLVKKIGVIGIEQVGTTGTDSYIYLDRINISKKHYPEAYIEIETKGKSGIKRKEIKVKNGDNLYELSGELTQYKEGFVVETIDGLENKIRFLNGIELKTGDVYGSEANENAIRRVQIRETIKRHFEKEKELFKKGIKVLSLFFIDEVSKYRKYGDTGNELKGEYASFFEEEYEKIKNEILKDVFLDAEYRQYLETHDAKNVHNGYFSIDKKGRFVDSKAKGKEKESDDISAYDLIMKDKERLLSFEEPTRFIFSHSALREGWDNPNVFQICTLRHTHSEISKRQEIGRGLRICVNQNGERMDSKKLEEEFFDINHLTIIANESYENFAKQLQNEILESLKDRITSLPLEVFEKREFINEDGRKVKLKKQDASLLYADLVNNGYLNDKDEITDKFIEDFENGKFNLSEKFKDIKKDIAKFMKKVYEDRTFKITENEKEKNIKIENFEPDKEKFEKFKELWNLINKKTIYEVDFNTDELIQKSIESINKNLKITPIKVKIVEGEQIDKFEKYDLEKGETLKTEKVKYENLAVDYGEIKYDLIGEISKNTKLLRKTIIKILQGISREKFDMFKLNPEEFILKVSNLINNEIGTTLIENIKYNLTEETYDNSIFTIKKFEGKLDENVIKVEKHIYNYLKFDSRIERKFAESGLEIGTEIKVYAKLPSDFKIETPVGNYNPDWAIVIQNGDEKNIYFIAETKGSLDSMEIREKERLKIEYAKKHFEVLNSIFEDKKIKYDVVDNYDALMKIVK